VARTESTKSEAQLATLSSDPSATELKAKAGIMCGMEEFNGLIIKVLSSLNDKHNQIEEILETFK
jgi:hypothetical protein